MKVAVASDHAGFKLKKMVLSHLRQKSIAVVDMGTYSTEPVDYPDFARLAAQAVSRGECERGIIICGTGIGASIAANKVRGVRAALCHDGYTARACREHNNANVLAMGERVIGEGVALEIVDIFLETPFAGGRHQRRVEKIVALEEQCDRR